MSIGEGEGEEAGESVMDGQGVSASKQRRGRSKEAVICEGTDRYLEKERDGG